MLGQFLASEAQVILTTGGTGLTGKYEQRDLWKEYRDVVLSFLDLKRPLKVAIDASNGMAGKMVPNVFGDVKNLQIVPILFEITGSFVHEPNPLVAHIVYGLYAVSMLSLGLASVVGRRADLSAPLGSKRRVAPR